MSEVDDIVMMTGNLLKLSIFGYVSVVNTKVLIYTVSTKNYNP